MRNLKKVLVLVLSLAMMLSIMVVGAGAFTDTDKIDDAHQNAVEMATQLKIINGYPDGSFQPKGDVTRAEISKMICIALNGGEVPATAVKAEPSYSDIKGNWAEGFIEYCTAKGIIAGYPDGTFKPGNNVTAAEAAKMMLVALGYDPKAENYEGEGWDLYVNVQANQDGLYTKLLDIQTTEALSREHTAQMVWNMLQAFTVQKTTSVDRTDGSITDVFAKTENTLFWESYRGGVKGGQMVGFTYNKDDAEWTYYVTGDNYWIMDGQVGKEQKLEKSGTLKLTSDTDYTALLGHNVKVVYNIDARNATFKADQGTAYGIYNDGSKEIVTACFGDIAKLTSKNNIDTIRIDGNTYRLEDNLSFANIPVYEFRAVTDITGRQTFQGGALGNTVLKDVIGIDKDQITRYDPQKFTAVDKDGNDKIDFLITTPFSFLKVDTLNGTKIQLYGAFVDNVNLADPYNPSLDPNKAATKRWLSDQVSAYDGIARGDYVKFTDANNTATIVDTLEKPDSVFSGKITSRDYPDVVIDGATYSFVDQHFYTGKGTTTGASKVGNELTDAMVVNGYIFHVSGLKRAVIDDYALVVGTDKGNLSGTQAKLLYWDNTTQIVDTAEDYRYMPNGTLVTYYKNADNEYVLEAVQNIPGDLGSDYSMQKAIAKVEPISNSDDGIGTVVDIDGNKASLLDNAVVFVKYLKTPGDYSTVAYKAIKGDQLKLNPVGYFNDDVLVGGTTYDIDKIPAGTVLTDANTLVLATPDAPKSGDNNAELVYIDLTAQRVIESNDKYAYVTGSRTDENGVKHVDLWTADGAQPDVPYAGSIEVRDSDGTPVQIDPRDEVIEAGMAIRYKTNNAGAITEIVSYYDVDNEGTGASYKGIDARTAGITALEPNDDHFAFKNLTGATQEMVNGKYFDLDDAVILYVDIDTNTTYNASGMSLDTIGSEPGATNSLVVYDNSKGTVKLIVFFVEE